MKSIGIAFISALFAIVVLAAPVLAISLAHPDSAPTVERIEIYRNVLETGDFLVIAKELTPYASPPTTVAYDDAFIWRLIDTDGTTELASATGYPYHEDGYNYNLVSFYLDAASVTAAGVSWNDLLVLRLSESPAFFTVPVNYSFTVSISDYSSITSTDLVKADLANLLLELGADFNILWSLTPTYFLTETSETGTTFSIYGQIFFRGAIYGVQAMAPAAFLLQVTNLTTDAVSFSDNYSTTLSAQLAGTYLETGLNAGNDFLDVDYNLFGLLLVVGMIVVLIFTHWYMKGGNIWAGLVESAPVPIIMSRMGVMGLNEVGLIAAVAWLFLSAKTWRVM